MSEPTYNQLRAQVATLTTERDEALANLSATVANFAQIENGTIATLTREKVEAVKALQNALLPLAALKISGEAKPYREISGELWSVLMAAHDDVYKTLSGLVPAPAPEQPKPLPLVDWSQVGPTARFTAMDSDGLVWWFTARPRCMASVWVGFTGAAGQVTDSAILNRSIPWRESLRERPATGATK